MKITHYSIKIWWCLICVLLLLQVPVIVLGHGSKTHDELPSDSLYFTEAVQVVVEERIGKMIPLNLKFKNEQGEQVVLSTLINKPTLLLPAYYSCLTDCGLQLSFLGSALKDLDSISYHDFQVVALSFDPDDTVKNALNAKNNYLPLTGDRFPAENWHFLTGDYGNIKRFLDGIGYRIKQTDKHLFNHPDAMVVLGLDGKIIRYLYGPRFLPFDIGMALTEAQAGRTGASVRKLLSYCIAYDSKQKRYTFQYIRVFGLVIPLFLILYYILFLRKGNQT